MKARVEGILKYLFGSDRDERTKLILMTVSFFFVIAAYTLTKELKDSVFTHIVGREFINYAKFLTFLVMVPAVFLYSKLVDIMRRYHLLSFYCLLYGILGLVFAGFLGHSTIGIANTDTSQYRLFGWIFYFFVEGYSPFIVSVFWAFANSITTPESAKKNYGIMVSGSKLGGTVGALIALFVFLYLNTVNSSFISLSDVATHQLILVISSAMLFVVPIMIYLLMKKVPGHKLHGYEAVYKAEKQRKKEGVEGGGILSGFKMLIKYPYVFGIFGLILFYEIINVVLGYQRISAGQSVSSGISGLSIFLYKIILVTHALGFLISLFGTRVLLTRIGIRRTLFLIPLVVGGLLCFLMFNQVFGAMNFNQNVLLMVYVALRSINYAVSYPVRESLYIPAVKEIKFKSKSWIDAFGSKFAKTIGSMFNLVVEWGGPALFLTLHGGCFVLVIGLWLAVAYLLGKRYDRAIKNKEVIGLEDQAHQTS